MILGLSLPSFQMFKALLNVKEDVEIVQTKTDWQKKRELEYFHNVVADIIHNIKLFSKNEQEFLKSESRGVLIKSTQHFPRIGTTPSFFSSERVPAFKVPKKDGEDFFELYSTEYHLRKPLKKLKRWMESNGFVNIRVYKEKDGEYGYLYPVFYIDENIEIKIQ